MVGHGERCVEAVVHERADVWIETVEEGVAVVLPRVVLGVRGAVRGGSTN